MMDQSRRSQFKRVSSLSQMPMDISVRGEKLPFASLSASEGCSHSETHAVSDYQGMTDGRGEETQMDNTEAQSPSVHGPEACHSFSPWAYGAEAGVDSWQPPNDTKRAPRSEKDFLSGCHFCLRSLDHYDIFMYGGNKAFCSLECRQHQMLVDHRNAVCKAAGRKFSMVPIVDDVSQQGFGQCRRQDQSSAMAFM